VPDDGYGQKHAAVIGDIIKVFVLDGNKCDIINRRQHQGMDSIKIPVCFTQCSGGLLV
jgi:hypothetical protein